MKTVVIIGAGPAGLTAGYEILKKTTNYKVIIYEKEIEVGGLSKTYSFDDNKVDVGGHRFFSKNSRINEIWDDVLPVSEKGMLIRNRKSHILYGKKLFEYPVNLNPSTIKELGFREAGKVLCSYIKSLIKKRDEKSLEDFYINHFGEVLYLLFFKKYTEKLWGVPASELSSDWGEQRVQKLSLWRVWLSMFNDRTENCKKERTLIKQFKYPAYGAGQLWSQMASQIVQMGGEIKCGSKVLKFENNNSKISKI